MPDTDISAQTVIADRYRLEEEIGRGAMGWVWRAEHLSLNVPVAVKLIKSELLESAEAKARFMREARAAATLRSTHVVQILDHGLHEDAPFIVMEFLQGESLADRLERRRALSFEETTHIVAQVSRALSLAHERGIVHRDLKPDNIFLAEEGEHEVVKVLDFGIAKDQGASLTATLETQEGAILGTPYYLSPEQAQGSLDVDHRSDLWALGVVAYECVTGRRPFESNHVGDLIVRICSRPIPMPSSVGAVPEGFDDWFGKAVARERDERFQSSSQLSQSLARLKDAVGATLSDSSRDLSADGNSWSNHTADTADSKPSATAELADSSTAISEGVSAETSSGAHPRYPTIKRTLLLVGGLFVLTVGLYFGFQRTANEPTIPPTSTQLSPSAPAAAAAVSDPSAKPEPSNGPTVTPGALSQKEPTPSLSATSAEASPKPKAIDRKPTAEEPSTERPKPKPVVKRPKQQPKANLLEPNETSSSEESPAESTTPEGATSTKKRIDFGF